MASAYTPGLTVSGDIVIRRTRRLPIKGQVLVNVGDPVEPETVLARALLPGPLQTIKLAEKLGAEPQDVTSFLRVKVGDQIESGQMVAETKGIFGKFKTAVLSDHTGILESLSEVTGNGLIREASIPVDIRAYVKGRVAEVMPGEGAIIETRGAMVQGIFGVGGETTGIIRVAVTSQSDLLEAKDIESTDAGKILVGGKGMTLEAIKKAQTLGVKGIIAGGVRDGDLAELLGYDIGVAITGQEAIGLTLMVTEGFGYLAMAGRTFTLLSSLQGQYASMNGATQIRAGVIRPEVIVPQDKPQAAAPVADDAFELKAGTHIRVIREPYFGLLGSVTELPSMLVTLESGTEVRVLRAKLDDGRDVTVPRANVEIIAMS